MSNEMPKDSTKKYSLEDLQDNAQLNIIKSVNKLSKQNIKKTENEKLLDDVESLRENAKIINALGRFLVWLFFGQYKIKNFKIYFVFIWIFFYVVFNVCMYEYSGEKASFYISLVDKIGLFLIVCILGKFLKDSISSIIKIFNK